MYCAPIINHFKAFNTDLSLSHTHTHTHKLSHSHTLAHIPRADQSINL